MHARQRVLSTKQDAETRFPHRIDIAVPQGGLGKRLNAMHDWCNRRLAAAAWAMHGHSRRRPGRVPSLYVRFYFLDFNAIEAFRQAWCPAQPQALSSPDRARQRPSHTISMPPPVAAPAMTVTTR